MMRLNRLGRRFMWSSMGVLVVVVAMILLAAQQMFISDQDVGFLLWIMIPATVIAAAAAWLLSAPIARDAERLTDAASRVAAGDLSARTGVHRSDELGDAARAFDRMAARLAAVEDERTLMLSSISHDLRTPLAALRASVEAIRDGVAVDPDAYLRGMEGHVQAVADLVDDLGLHTRLASGTVEWRRERFDVSELADEIVESMQPIAAGSDVRIEFGSMDRIELIGDPSQLGRLFRNLLDNAIRYAPQGTAIVVDVDEAADGVVVTVSDRGHGFPPDLRERAFEPFTRGDPARDTRTGTAGLGLAIARGIVEAHGGSIELGDGPGGVVVVQLPTDSARPTLVTTP